MILGNRATTTRKIGSDAYADYLNDMMTSRFYENQLPVEDNPNDLVGRGGHRLWKSSCESESDPWLSLIVAVISMAAKDYVVAVRSRDQYRVKELEKFFSDNDEARPVFEELRRRLRWAGDDWHRLNRVERTIRVMF